MLCALVLVSMAVRMTGVLVLHGRFLHDGRLSSARCTNAFGHRVVARAPADGVGGGGGVAGVVGAKVARGSLGADEPAAGLAEGRELRSARCFDYADSAGSDELTSPRCFEDWHQRLVDGTSASTMVRMGKRAKTEAPIK